MGHVCVDSANIGLVLIQLIRYQVVLVCNQIWVGFREFFDRSNLVSQCLIITDRHHEVYVDDHKYLNFS